MRKIWLLVINLALVLAAVGLSSCSPGNTTLGDINLNSQQEGIWVTGQGKVTVTPDLAILRLGIVAQEASVAEAQSHQTQVKNAQLNRLLCKDHYLCPAHPFLHGASTILMHHHANSNRHHWTHARMEVPQP